MRFFSDQRAWLHRQGLRLYCWLEVRVAQKAIQLKSLSCRLIDAEIRSLKPNLLQFGEDNQLDLLVEYIARQLTGRELLPELSAMACDARALELLELSQKSDSIRQAIACYHMADAFFARFLNDDARKDTQICLALTAIPGILEYSTKSIYHEYAKSITRLKKLRSELAERSAIKMEFSISAISGVVAIASAALVMAGFLYAHYFYRRMGVDVSLYFSIGDYLAASIEQIRSGAFATAIALGMFAFGVRAASLRSRLHTIASANAMHYEGFIIFFFTLALCGLSAYSIYVGEPIFSLLRMTCLLLSYWIADHISNAFFKNKISAMAGIVGSLIFFSNVAISAYERSEYLLTDHDDSTYKQKLLFKEDSPQVNGQIFGANSAYYFIYSQQKRLTYVIPRDRVTQIEITKLGQ